MSKMMTYTASIPFDPNIFAYSNDSVKFVEKITSTMNGSHQDGLIQTGLNIIGNLIKLSTLKIDWVRISRSGKDYTYSSFYGFDHFNLCDIRKVMGHLRDFGYIDVVTGNKKVGYTRFQPTQRLKEHIDKIMGDPKPVIDIRHGVVAERCRLHPVVLKAIKNTEKRLVIVKGRDKRLSLARYRDPLLCPNGVKQQLARVKARVKKINRSNENNRFTIDKEAIIGLAGKVFLSMMNQSDPANTLLRFPTRLYRVFNQNSLCLGGRFYGCAIQNLPSYLRSQVRIDGNPTVELDFKTMHPDILYGKTPFCGDAYTIYGFKRKAVKLAFNVMLNSDNKQVAKRTINHLIKSSLQVNNLVDAILKVHEPIKKYFFTGYGRTLQNIDSKIAEKVLLHFASLDEGCMTIHDSFIVRDSMEGELKSAMNRAYMEVAGSQPKIMRV